MRLWAETQAWLTLDPEEIPLLLDFSVTYKPYVTTQLACGLLLTAETEWQSCRATGATSHDALFLRQEHRRFVLCLCSDLVRLLLQRARRAIAILAILGRDALQGTPHAACERWYLSDGLLPRLVAER